MRRSTALASAAMVLAWVPAAAAAQQSSLAADAAAFGAREGASNMDLSPDGNRIVYIAPGPGRVSVAFVGDLATGAVKPIIKSSADPESLGWCGFISDQRLACRYYATRREEGYLVGYGRMIAMDVDGSNLKELGQRSSAYDERIRQFDGAIIDWLPGDGGDAVLMTRDFVPEAGKSDSLIVRSADGLGVVKVNARTLKTEIVERPSKAAGNFMSDGQGHVRILAIPEVSAAGLSTGKTRYQYRTANSREWQMLVDYQKDSFFPLTVDAGSNSLYALKKLNGRLALYRVRLDGSLAAEMVASNPKVDIDDVVRAGDGQRVIGYTFADDRRRTVYFDPEYEKLRNSLSKALPHLPLIYFLSSSSDGQKILLFAGSDTDPGNFYLFDKASKSLGQVLPARSSLAGRTMANVKSIAYAAADGTQIPAYLTLPAGSSGKGLAAVVLPHGGPSARDEWGFDWLAQYLAARGYAVIQPNYRGSAGFGDSWLAQNGFKGWQTSISDVSSAARWLVSQGIADPKRVAIVGWSYGGYAALQSAVTEPALYKAVVAVAPVTDLGLLKSDFHRYSSRRVAEDFVGSGPHIETGSPLRRAAAINVPVLLVHGDMDENVDVGHSRKMHAALRGAGKSSELLEFKGLDHQLEDTDARRQMLTSIGALLERTIGH